MPDEHPQNPGSSLLLFSLSSLGLSYHLDNNLPCTRAVVEIQKDYLLPCSEKKLTSLDGDLKRGSQKRGTEMRETVVISPALVVVVSLVGWDEPLQEIFEVSDQSRLVFDCGEACRGPGNKQANQPAPDFLPLHLVLNLVGDVDDVTESLSLFLQSVSMDFHLGSYQKKLPTAQQ